MISDLIEDTTGCAMCVVEDSVVVTSSTMHGPGKRQKRGMDTINGTCDSSNCIYCQENAQRFGEIVRQYYHHPIPTTTECGRTSFKMKKAGCQECRSMKASNSSIWDYEAGDADRRLVDVVQQKEGDFKVRHVDTKQRGFLDVGQFSGCWGKSNPCHKNVDIVCGLEFEERGWLFAAAGVSKQVRVYSLAKLLEEQVHENEPIRMHRLANKLSSLSWNPTKNGVVSVGDYDGVVTEIDLETGHIINESDGHSGRRVWSVSHSVLQKDMMASASEDGSIAIWDVDKEVVMRISPSTDIGGSKSPITGVQMSPWDSNLVGIASASSLGYVYDIRQHNRPLKVLRGHERPVSYIKFLDQNTVVTAGIDSSLIAWDLCNGEKIQVYKGHCNNKHFVGLSVRPEDGLIACGSETGEVFCYEKGHETSIAKHLPRRFESSKGSNVFCSAIAWQPASTSPLNRPILASAFADGSVDVCALKQ